MRLSVSLLATNNIHPKNRWNIYTHRPRLYTPKPGNPQRKIRCCRLTVDGGHFQRSLMRRAAYIFNTKRKSHKQAYNSDKNIHTANVMLSWTFMGFVDIIIFWAHTFDTFWTQFDATFRELSKISESLYWVQGPRH